MAQLSDTQPPADRSRAKLERARRLSTPKERLTTPLVRIDGVLTPTSWDDALDKVASTFSAIRSQHGSDAFGLFSCSKSTNEMNYAAQKFSRVALGSNNIDSCNRT